MCLTRDEDLLAQAAGKSAAANVMEGREQIKEKTDKKSYSE
jgi:hypothetical protein